jgi:hypothetical protein
MAIGALVAERRTVREGLDGEREQKAIGQRTAQWVGKVVSREGASGNGEMSCLTRGAVPTTSKCPVEGLGLGEAFSQLAGNKSLLSAESSQVDERLPLGLGSKLPVLTADKSAVRQ